MAGGRPGRPGRPRRDSNSTVASVDLSHVSYVQEMSVLKSTDRTDSDDWPCFVLKDAVVYRKSEDGQLVIANVCNLNLEGPCVVRGKLDIDLSEHKHLMRNFSYRSAYIEIPFCQCYSIGFGPWPAVWASGEAGWYEINPAPEYEAMYECVCEGITLYYKIMDAYQERTEILHKGKRLNPFHMPIERLLLKYAVAVGDGITLSEAKKRCDKHAPFLLAQFEGERDIDWGSTSFKRWMTSSHWRLVRKLEEAKKPPPPPEASPEADVVAPKKELDHGTLDLPWRISPDAHRSRRSKSRASRQSEEKDVPEVPRVETQFQPPSLPPVRPPHTAATPHPQAGDTSSTAVQNPGSPAQPQDPVQFLRIFLEEILKEQGGDALKITKSKVQSQMYAECRIKAYRAAKEILHFYARPLVASMSSKWYPSPFFQWLKNARDQPWTPEVLTKDEVPGQCRRRTKLKKVITRNRSSGPRKPSPPRGAGKRWPPSSSITPRIGGLRPGTGAKRPARYDDEDDSDERASKAAKIKHELEEEELEGEGEEDEDVVEDVDEDEDEDEDEKVNDPSEAVQPMAGVAASVATPALDTRETVRIVIRAEKIPSMLPSGPNGTWRCEESGCSYIVRSAEEQEGKDLIAKHFRDHSTRADKLDLALAEGTRGHMPINHLLNKIRNMGKRAESKEQGEIDGVSVPRPIKRRLIV